MIRFFKKVLKYIFNKNLKEKKLYLNEINVKNNMFFIKTKKLYVFSTKYRNYVKILIFNEGI